MTLPSYLALHFTANKLYYKIQTLEILEKIYPMEISQSPQKSTRAVVLRCWHPAGNNPIKTWFMWGTTDKTCPISSLIFPPAELHHIFSTSALAQANPQQHIQASGSGHRWFRGATAESTWTVAGSRLLVLRRQNSHNSKNSLNWTRK